MTAAARLVLQDCSQALQEFTPGITGARWRIVYMANVTLLRTVYHVLKNRDASSNARLALAFKEWDARLLTTKPHPEIYWDFIVSERNLLLKEYSATPVEAALVHEVQFDLSTGKATNLGLVRQEYLMAEGPFAGIDQRRLVKQAISWWQSELESLERAAGAA